MNNFDIEASLRKVNQKFIEDLTAEEKKNVLKKFKKAYAQQIAKLSLEVSKRVKVQENLDQINEQEMKEVKEIDLELRKKMEKHSSNREKLQESKQKEYKLQEENWKRRLDDIIRKNKQKERQAFQKAQAIRKQAEEFWTKKQEVPANAEDGLRVEQSSKTSRVAKHEHSANKQPATLAKRNKSLEAQSAKKMKFELPQVTRIKINKNELDKNKTFNQASSANKLNADIKAHQQKCIQTTKQRQQQNYQKIIQKLQKIEKTRSLARQRIQKQVKQAKRIRELRQNPQTIAENIKKAEQQLKFLKSKENKQSPRAKQLKNGLSKSQSGSRSNLDNSIMSRLETHHKIKQADFQRREESFQRNLKKIRTTKINRVVRDAINMIKHQTLYE